MPLWLAASYAPSCHTRCGGCTRRKRISRCRLCIIVYWRYENLLRCEWSFAPSGGHIYARESALDPSHLEHQEVGSSNRRRECFKRTSSHQVTIFHIELMLWRSIYTMNLSAAAWDTSRLEAKYIRWTVSEFVLLNHTNESAAVPEQ